MNIGGEIVTIDRYTLSNLIQFFGMAEKQPVFQNANPSLKKIITDTKRSVEQILTKMAVLQKDRAFIRIAVSPEATHDIYFECVTIPREQKKTLTEAMTEALNLVIYQSKASADVELVYQREGDNNYEFVIKVKQY